MRETGLLKRLAKVLAILVLAGALMAGGAGIYAWATSEGGQGQTCVAAAAWSEATQELYFIGNDATLTYESMNEKLNEQFHAIANVTLLSKRSATKSGLLPLMYEHNSEVEHWLSVRGRVALSELEATRLQLNETIRTINGFLMDECAINPIILYQSR